MKLGALNYSMETNPMIAHIPSKQPPNKTKHKPRLRAVLHKKLSLSQHESPANPDNPLIGRVLANPRRVTLTTHRVSAFSRLSLLPDPSPLPGGRFTAGGLIIPRLDESNGLGKSFRFKKEACRIGDLRSGKEPLAPERCRRADEFLREKGSVNLRDTQTSAKR